MSSGYAKQTRGRAPRFSVRPLLVALAAAGVLAPMSGHAATIAVTTGGDAGGAGTCTLRQAVTSLNTAALAGTTCANSGAVFGTGDTVDLTTFVGTITLGGTELLVSKDMTFLGPVNPATVVITGGMASRVINATNQAITIRNLTIAKGSVVGPGGCIYGNNVSLDNAIVTGCRTTRDPLMAVPAFGGGIFASTVNMTQSTVSGNTAAGAGGGVAAKYLSVQSSVISGNTVAGGTCTFDVNNNSQKYCVLNLLGGGGILSFSATSIVSSTVSGNTVNATTLVDAANANNNVILGLGGGITHLGTGNNPLLGLQSSTVSGNVIRAPAVVGANVNGKYAGGGIVSKYANAAEVTNSTISGNTLPAARPNNLSYGRGSALFAPGAHVSNSTITNNTGSVAVDLGQGTTPPVLDSTIIGGNFGGDDLDCNNCAVGGSRNLIQKPAIGVVLPPGTIVGQNPTLAPLGNNGGTVNGASGHALTGSLKTHILFLGSPALNNGSNVLGFTNDQRGPGFPRVTGAAADIGAVEGAIPLPAPAHIPALGPWMLGLLSGLVGLFGLLRRRRSP